MPHARHVGNRGTVSWIVNGFLLLLVGTLLVGTLPEGRQVAAEEKEGTLPSDLAAVPSDALVFFSIRVSDLWTHEALKEARETFIKEVPEVIKEFEGHVGLGFGAVERISFSASAVQGGGPVVFVRSLKPFEQTKVLAAMGADAAAEKVNGRDLYMGRDYVALTFIDNSSYIIGPPNQVKDYLEKGSPKKDGPLADAIRKAAGKHTMVQGANVEAIAREIGDMLPPEIAPFKPILQARTATAVTDFGNESKLSAELKFAKEADAAEGAKAIKVALGLADLALTPVIQKLAQETGSRAVGDLAKAVQTGIKGAQLEQKGTTVTLNVSVKTDLAVVASGTAQAVQKVREAAARTQSANNLKQLALAMHNYHDQNGAFPPAAIYDKDGKALLSWRVLLLPYVEQDQLYKQFHLDEPWDSEHNKKLLDKMPKIFASPVAANLKEYKSSYLGFAGKGALFDGTKGKRMADITDGTSNTIMFIETKGGVEWSKPGDIPFDADKPLSKVGGLHAHGTNAAFCDGSVRFLIETIKETTLKALVTIAGGEVIDQNDF
jgi:prepilin-type processing-associated H-X9-DG protein